MARRARRLIPLPVAFVLAIASCGGGKTASTTRPARAACPVGAVTSASKPVTVRFWNALLTAQNQALLHELIDRFEAAHRNIRVELLQFPGLAEVLTKYRAGLSTGDIPDLMQLPETAVQAMVDSRSTVPIQACVEADHYSLADYVPRAIDYYTTTGVLRAMPWTVGDPVLYYDKAAFARAGLDPERPPRTLAEVHEFSRRIVTSGAAKHGIALRVEGFLLEYWFAKDGRLYVDHDNGRAGRATKTLLDNDTGRSAFMWWKEMVSSGLALDTGSAPGNYDHLFAVGNHNAAMTIEAASGLGPIEKLLGSGQYGDVRIGVGALPGIATGGGLPVGDSALWIPSGISDARKAAAWQLVKFLDEPAQQASLHAGAGYVPIRTSAVKTAEVRDLWASKPEYRVAYDQLVAGPRTVASAGAVIGDFQGVRDAVRDAITAMLTGGLSPEQALQRAQRDATAAIAAYDARVG